MDQVTRPVQARELLPHVNPAPICNAGTALGKQRAFVTSQTYAPSA